MRSFVTRSHFLKALFFSKLFFLSLSGWSQSFEGSILYDIDIQLSPKFEKLISKEEFITKLKSEGLFSEQIRVSYKGGNYRTEGVNESKVLSVYRADSNKIFTFFPNSNFIEAIDASMDLEFLGSEKKPLVQLKDTSVKINDKVCKVVRIKWKAVYYDYYFADNFLSADSEKFSNHDYDGWASYLKISKAYPVRIVKVTKGVSTIVYTLNSFSVEKIADDIFKLPRLLQSDIPAIVPNKKIMIIPE